MAILTVFLEVGACVGLGSAFLRFLGILRDGPVVDRVAWAFALGFGLLGWLLFLVGISEGFSPVVVASLLAVACTGLWWLRDGAAGGEAAWIASDHTGWIDALLLLGLAAVLGGDLMEGLAPPSDADSMAYHFATPKLFWKAGHIEFIPRAIDGAIPLLVHMSYVPAYGLGGELGLTLWTMVSGWAAALLLYCVARRYLNRQWALAATLLFLSTPGVLYGSGTGQVEVRNAIFAMVGAFGMARALKTGDLRWAVLAGLGAGFFIGSKFTGLLFGLACGLPILAQKRWFVHGATLAAVAFVTGGQWYFWNWLHTGDPIFPILYGVVDYRSTGLWNLEYKEALNALVSKEENAVPHNILWLLAYPVVATFHGYPVFESGRTGLGPFAALAAPFAVIGMWRKGKAVLSHPLAPLAVVAAIYYAAWFLSGHSQRIRHLVPIYPILVLCLMVAAHYGANRIRAKAPLAGAVVLTLGLQIAIQGFVASNAAPYVLGAETREAYLRRNVPNFEAVSWINKHLTQEDKVFTARRFLLFHLDIPYFYAHYAGDPRIDVRREATDSSRFCAQLQTQGITHLLVGGHRGDLSNADYPATGKDMWRRLDEKKCLKHVKSFETPAFRSRTLSRYFPAEQVRIHLFALDSNACDICLDGNPD